MSETSKPAAPRGWYQDPNEASIDRWWDGMFWTSHTHKSATLRRTMYGPTWARMWWPGPNRAAGRSMLFARIAIGAFALAVIVTLLLASSGHRHADPAAAAVLGVLLVGASALSIAGIVMGALGTAASGRLGARVLAIWGLCASVIAAGVSVPVTLLFLV